MGSQCWLAEECDWAEGWVGGVAPARGRNVGLGAVVPSPLELGLVGGCGGREVGRARAHGRGAGSELVGVHPLVGALVLEAHALHQLVCLHRAPAGRGIGSGEW